MTSVAPHALQVVSRVAAGLLGSYGFVWGFTSLGIVAGVSLGMPYGEARTLLQLLAFVVFLVCLCWAFAAARLARVWAVLAGGGAAMTAAAWWISGTLV